MTQQGAILLNVGTPQSPEQGHVKEYLKEFLMDPFVIDIPYLLRWFTVNGLILPRRPAASAAAYQKIWTERGSPLYFHLIDLVDKVQVQLGDAWDVQPAMRYGQPSITKALRGFRDKGIRDVKIFPLYPQYSLAATETGIQECRRLATQLTTQPEVHEFNLTFVDPFYHHPLFVDAFAAQVRNAMTDFQYDHLLFSFHGLPERQIKKTDASGAHCLSKSGCCEAVSTQNNSCYRAQCYHTARMIAAKLELKPDAYTVCFQSRLGRTPWIQPFTDQLYQQLPARGVKKLGVVCPAFVADCLETLEEIQIRGKADFIRHGGEDLKLVPSLNSGAAWSRAVAEILSI